MHTWEISDSATIEKHLTTFNLHQMYVNLIIFNKYSLGDTKEKKIKAETIKFIKYI